MEPFSIVLGGGGAKGFAHIGVLETLNRFEIPVNTVVGSSIGALIGGIYASGKLKEFRKYLLNVSKKEIYKLFIGKPTKKGLIKQYKIKRFLNKFIQDIKIEELPMKYAATTFDLVKGEFVIIQKGLLVDAILSAITIPGLFVPIKTGQQFLVDASFIKPLPINIAKKISSKNKIIAVSLIPLKVDKLEITKAPNIIKTLLRIIEINETGWLKTEINQADILINPEVKINSFQYHLAEKAIMTGEKAALSAIIKIKKF